MLEKKKLRECNPGFTKKHCGDRLWRRELGEIVLRTPICEMLWPDQTTTTDEYTTIFKVIEYSGSHAAVTRRCGEVVCVRAKDAFKAAASSA